MYVFSSLMYFPFLLYVTKGSSKSSSIFFTSLGLYSWWYLHLEFLTNLANTVKLALLPQNDQEEGSWSVINDHNGKANVSPLQISEIMFSLLTLSDMKSRNSLWEDSVLQLSIKYGHVKAWINE